MPQPLERPMQQTTRTMWLAKVVRIITTPPVFAALLVWLLHRGGVLPPVSAWLAAVFLAVLPLAAYPVSYLIPALRKRGRRAQRPLAVLFSVAGYLGGTVCCLLRHGDAAEWALYLTYLATGLLIALFSYAFHIKSSGHSAGAAGPIAMLAWRLGPWYLFGFLLLVPVFWSSLKLSRHTLPELLLGAAFPVAAVLVWSVVF